MQRTDLIRLAVTGGLLGLLLPISGCGEAAIEKPDVVRPVKTFVYGAADSRLRFRYPARVHANRTVEVAFEVTGKIAELPVVRGQEVKKGALLARLDQRDFKNALAGAEGRLNEAAATLSRLQQAAKSGAVAPQQVDEALARKNSAEAAVKIRRKALGDSELRADFDGVVAQRYVEQFQNIVAKQPIFSMQDISKLEIRITVPESDMTRTGSDPGKMTAVFAAAPGREFPLTLKEFALEADPVTQTFLVTLLMPRPEEIELLPGMTATVIWQPPVDWYDRTPVIPAVAVGGRPGETPWVWVIDPSTKTVSRREVTVGQIVQKDMIEIRSGLKKGEVVATAGVYHLEEGMKVRAF